MLQCLCKMLGYIEDVLPDRVFGAIAVDSARVIQDDVSSQVSIIVMSGVVVGNDPRWDAQTTQDYTDQQGQKSVAFPTYVAYDG